MQSNARGPFGRPVDASGAAIAGHVSPNPKQVQETAARGLRGGGPLPHLETIQRSFGKHDVSTVQAHLDPHASGAAAAIGAEAYTVGDHVAFAAAPGLHTAAHEAAHVVQQQAGARIDGGVGREGDAHERHADAVADRVVQGRSAEDLLDRYAAAAPSSAGVVAQAGAPAVQLQRGARAARRAAAQAHAMAAEFDLGRQVQQALDEIRDGTALAFHANQSLDRVRELGRALGLSRRARRANETDWVWFLDHGPPGSARRASNADWNRRRAAFTDRNSSSLEERAEGMTAGQLDSAAQRFNDTPASVFRIINEVATAEVPPALLYAVALVEGLDERYLRPQISGATGRLSDTQRDSLRTDLPVDGFTALGLDDFYTDLPHLRLPRSFSRTRNREVARTNERGRTVRSLRAENLRAALQAMVAMLTYRQEVFGQDRAALRFRRSTPEERVYFTYVYYNSGIGNHSNPNASGDGGYQTLYRHRPDHPTISERRVLSDWITNNEYSNAMHVLRLYRAIVGEGVLRGFTR